MKVTLYTIYSPRFKGYYNEKYHCLEKRPNEDTRLYANKSDATRKIEGIINEVYDMPYNRLCTELAWKYLEHKYNIDKWHLDIKYDELRAAEDLFKDLEIKKVTLDVEV